MSAGSPTGQDTLKLVLGEHARFSAFLRRRLRDEALAEDVLQSAYATVLSRDAGPRDRTKVVAWFFRVLRRAAIDQMRRRETSRRHEAAARPGRTSWTPADDGALRDQVCACIARLLPGLRGEYADILRRVELDGDSVREAAGKLGITPGNAAVRVTRARKALARELADVCGSCTAHGCRRCTCSSAGGHATV